MKKIQFIFLSLIMLSMTSMLNVNAQSSISDKESARIFVQTFYDWYNKEYNTDPNDCKHKYPEGLNTYAFRNKQQYFDEALLKIYNDYDRVEPKNADEIVGLDFDPILHVQEDGHDYQTGIVKQVGDKYFVNIHSGLAGQSRKSVLKEKVHVITEVAKENGQWKFVSFQYPTENGSKSDIIITLKNCKKEAEEYNASHKITELKN